MYCCHYAYHCLLLFLSLIFLSLYIQVAELAVSRGVTGCLTLSEALAQAQPEEGQLSRAAPPESPAPAHHPPLSACCGCGLGC